jgi:cytochrome c oxidase subunit 1
MFVSGMSPYVGEFFSIGTLLITIPSAIVGLNLLASLWGASVRFTTAMLFALGVIALFGTGGLGGIFLGTATSNIYLHDTYFVVGHFHYMIGGVTLFSIFAGTYYWFPKIFGRVMNEKLGKLHFWLSLVCFYGVFLSMHFFGLAGAPRRYYAFTKFEFLQALQGLNVFITVSAFALGAAQFAFLFNFFWSLLKGPGAERNPWKATTLEWSAPSPPPHGNWGATLPTVHRWPYEYSVPGAPEDYTPQTVPPAEVPVTA